MKALKLFFLVSIALLLCGGLRATTTRTLLSSSTNLWEGFPRGVTVSFDNVISPSVAYGGALPLPATPLCSARVGDVLYVGTAPGGDVYTLSNGKVEKKAHFDSLMVTALAAAPGNALLVGTSRPARLYRLNTAKGGKSVLLASFKSEYLWSLAVKNSSVYVATGKPGRVFRVKADGKTASLLDPSALNVTSLVKHSGALYACTASPAALYRLDAESAFCVASFKEKEVSVLLDDGDTLWIGVNGELSEVSDPDPKNPPSFKGKSALYRVGKNGVPLLVHSFDSPITCGESGKNGVYVGLGDGRLFKSEGSKLFFSARWKGHPVANVNTLGERSVVMTVSPPMVRFSIPGAKMSYTSPVIDAGTPALFGRGSIDGRGSLFLRAGNTPEPDGFWSRWTPEEDTLHLSPSRYFQWKTVLAEGGKIRLVSISYRPKNRPPVFESAMVNPPGMIKAQSAGQLGDHLVREVNGQASPFPALAKAPGAATPPQVYYLQGYRMISWKVSDPDGDEVTTRVEIRPDGSDHWITLVENVKDSYYAFDARGLPDGLYIPRLTASDAPCNQEGDAGKTVLTLPVFLIDNTAPTLKLSSPTSGKLLIVASDSSSIQSVRASMDGGEWMVPKAAMGKEGGRTRRYTLDFSTKGNHWIAVQAVDSSGNMATAGWLTKR